MVSVVNPTALNKSLVSAASPKDVMPLSSILPFTSEAPTPAKLVVKKSRID